jgi:RNA polymerase sigma factor (sigma-70 family)
MRVVEQTMSDEQLMTRYRMSGDMSVIGELYNRYAHLVMGVCYKLLGNEEDAYDHTMLLFEKLTVSLGSTEVSSFNHWIYTAATNLCLTTIRSKKSGNYIKSVSMDAVVELVSEPDSEDHIALNDSVELLEKAILQLSEIQQTCIRKFFYEKKSYKSISVELNLAENMVKSHLQNGKKNLRKILDAAHGK